MRFPVLFATIICGIGAAYAYKVTGELAAIIPFFILNIGSVTIAYIIRKDME